MPVVPTVKNNSNRRELIMIRSVIEALMFANDYSLQLDSLQYSSSSEVAINSLLFYFNDR